MVIGITGGIASGKTTVCRIFSQHGALVIDADEIGREVVEQNEEVLKRLVAEFGERILNQDGSLNRRELGRLAFSNYISKSKLDKIVHPYLLRRLRDEITQLRRKHPERMIVVDAALLVEWGILDWFDVLIVVVSRREDQVRRLVQQGLTLEEAQQRIKAQLPVEKKVEKADYVIYNTGDHALLHTRSLKVWKELIGRSEQLMANQKGGFRMREVSRAQADARWSRPERVVLAVSVDRKGKADIIALGWKMKTSGTPPMVAISVGKTRYSHKLISEGGEFVLAVPGEDIWKEVLYCGTHSGREVDKFQQTGLTPLPAKFVTPPLIKECVVNLECKVVGELDTGDHTIFAGEVLNYWASEEEKRNLLSIGQESGYEFLGGGKGYKFGVIKR